MTACGSSSETETVVDSTSIEVDIDSAVNEDTTVVADSAIVGSGTSDRTARIYVK